MKRKNNKQILFLFKLKKVNERGETPLHVAAINGNIERVETLLKQVTIF